MSPPVRSGAGSAPNARAGISLANGRVRVAVFVLAAGVLVGAFAALVRYQGVRSPLGIAALLAIELAAIALAVAFHLVELPGVAPGAVRRADPLLVDVDYL